MATQTNKQPSYTYRASWAIVLLALNIFIAAIYAHIIEI